MNHRTSVLEVWGEFACFSRPEMKVERFSYPVITPSAVRGIFDAIYCKPNKDPTQAEFRWQITKIEILAPVAYIALRRNEVKEKVSVNAIAACVGGSELPLPIMADVDRDYWGTDVKGRTQRQTMALKNVRYRLHAQIRPWPRFAANQVALDDQFRRRASHGKCIYQPYFGCREFPAYFQLLEETSSSPSPMPFDLDIGLMLYDVFDLSRPGTGEDQPSISLFHATVTQGVLNVPDYESEDVLKGKRRER